MKKAGIYIHIPFCAVKCMYCDFYSIADQNDQIPSFIEALIKEIKISKMLPEDRIFDTVFIGGGTPSLIEAKFLERIISALDKKFDLSNVNEFTIEANPGEAPKERLKDFLSLGINRLSIGVQSLHPHLLSFLTRIHDATQVFTTFENARSVGFQNISCDLIYSIPGQTWSMWEKDLRKIISLQPNHISAYTLTVEKGTSLFELVRNRKVQMPIDDETGKWFLDTHKILEESGYPGYEISNFGSLDMQCKHNLHYWRIDPYMAFGPSAHGFDGQRRWNNTRSLNNYFQKIKSNEKPISTTENLSDLDLVNEALGFGLRMKEGFNISLIPNQHLKIFDKKYKKIKKEYPKLIYDREKRIFLTIKGMLLSDQIIPELLFE
ncbi:radical SAM family heme chaperone HemW [Candidatus Marinimicrobia bacterium]|jgi:oxygen-independent coproporphyrinogen-3 oxidase|nr:radical SAM family heme chaperone HemW [Candidatus Neomarinimicrobiota bacterium]MDC0383447.1 radical SAM family heme chaperone HemW [Candidatus Neomarinimicrobiota bacterium]